MKRLGSLIHKDWSLITKNYFFYVTLFFAVLMIVVINYVVPEDVSLEQTVYVVFEYEAPEVLRETFESNNYQILLDRKAMDEALRDNLQSIGILFVDEATALYRLQGHENEKTKAYLQLGIEAMYGEYYAELTTQTRPLRDYSQVEDVPFNKLLLPLFHVMEPALLGLFLIATMIFSEKEENTITVYATTPAGVNVFLLSKTIVMMLLGQISLLLTTFLVVGFKANYVWLMLLTLVCGFMGAALGLLLASFFDNIASAMLWIICLSLLLSMPFASYFTPSFSPVWMKALPTYYMLFAFKEAVFPTGEIGIILQTLMLCGAVGIVAYGLALFKFRKMMVHS